MEVYKSDTLTIRIDKENSILFYQWSEKSEDLSQDEFLREAQLIHDEILRHKVDHVLADDRDFLYAIIPEIQVLMAEQLLESLNKFGLKKFAHVSSRAIIPQLSVEQLFEENQNSGYVDKYFDDIDKAKEWILSL